MNTITIAEIKRGGMVAIDIALNRGIATIMKRNRPAAIVLSPQAYEVLLAQAAPASKQSSVLDGLLNASYIVDRKTPALEGAAIKRRLRALKEDWQER